MKQEQEKQSEIIEKDDSTIGEKYDSLIKSRIAKKTRNTFKQKILTLRSDIQYIMLLLKPKYRYATRSEENHNWQQKVLTDYFKDSARNLYIMQTNFSLQKHAVLVGNKIKEYPDMSVAMYVAINKESREENGKNNKKITTAEMVLLSRFDPGQKFDHINMIEENTLKAAYFGQVVSPGEPHFHFASRTQALKYNDTAGCDAISLDNLIQYISNLIRVKKNSELLRDDLSMPYLSIKYDPNLYQTSSKITRLADAIPSKYLLKKSFMFGTVDSRADIFGLEAVLFDLILLRGLLRTSQAESGSMLLHELTVKLASKIASAGICEEINNELASLIEEVNIPDRQREL